MAEERGFEPLHHVTDLLAFQASPFSHLGIPPEYNALQRYYYIIFESKRKDVLIIFLIVNLLRFKCSFF